MLISGMYDQGIHEWLEFVLNSTYSGKKILEVDYDIYAQGEAVLGWVNSNYELQGMMVNPKETISTLLEALLQSFISINAPIGHVKVFLKNQDDEFLIGNLVKNTSKVSTRGEMKSFIHGKLTVNARVQMESHDLYF